MSIRTVPASRIILGASALAGGERRTMAFAANSCDISNSVTGEGTPRGEVTTRVLADGMTIQFLKGDAARAYMDDVYRKNPLRAAAHAKGQKLLADMGYAPADRVYVLRHFNPQRPFRTTLVSFRLTPAQTYDYNSGSEDFTWYSSDTGDNSTWTGQFSYANSSTNDWGDWSANHDDSDINTIWSQVNWSYLNGDSTGGCCRYVRDDEPPCASCGVKKVRAHYPDVWYGTNRPRALPAAWRGNYRAFYGCAAAWCGGAALGGYLFAGPAAPEAFTVGCTTALVGCSYGSLWY